MEILTLWMDLDCLGNYAFLALLITFTIAFLSLDKEYLKAMLLVAHLISTTFIAEVVTEYLLDLREYENIVWPSIYLLCTQALNIGHKRFLIMFAVLVSATVGLIKFRLGEQNYESILFAVYLAFLANMVYYRSINFSCQVPFPRRRFNDPPPSSTILEDTPSVTPFLYQH